MKRALLLALVSCGPGAEYVRAQDEAAAYRRAYEAAEERSRVQADAVSELAARVSALEQKLGDSASEP